MKTKQMDFLKRLASFVLAFIMVFSASPIVLQAYEDDGDYDAYLDYGYEEEEEEGDSEENPEETLEETPYISFTPFSSTVNAAINGIPFGPGSSISLPLFPATFDMPQTVEVNADFSDLMSGDGVLVFRIENGLHLGGADIVPGRIPGTGPNWQFDVNRLSPLQYAAVSDIRWILDEPIVQDLTGNTFQPASGTLIYVLRPEAVVNLGIQVRSQFAFAITHSPGRTHTNAITVSTFENIGITGANLNTLTSAEVLGLIDAATPTDETTLESYILTGQTSLILIGSGGNRIFSRGEAWTTSFDIRSLNHTGGSTTGRILFEEMEFTARFHRDLQVEGIRPVGTQITDGINVPLTGPQPMLTFDPPVVDPSNSDFYLLSVRLVQPFATAVNLQFYGTIAADAQQGVSRNFTIPHAYITPLAGATSGRMALSQWGQTAITIPFDPVNRLQVNPFTSAAANNFSAIPSDAALTQLGGFLVSNSFSEPLTNQAMHIVFDYPNIGVRALRLPAGNAGISDLVAQTSEGNTIIMNNLPISGTRVTFPFVNINLHNQLGDDEYVTEVFIRLGGIVAGGAMHGGEQGSNLQDTHTLFAGRVLNPAAGTDLGAYGGFRAYATVGEFAGDPNDIATWGIVENPYGVGENDPERLRDTATNIMRTSTNAVTNFSYAVTGNLSGGTLVGGNNFSRLHVQFNYSHWAAGNNRPSALRGHYVYLRAPLGVVEIDPSNIVATWAGNTYRVADGTLVVDALPLADTGGHPVFRIAFPDVILGVWNENFATYSNLRVYFDIRANATVPTGSIPASEVAMIVPMNPNLVTNAHTGSSPVRIPNFTDHRVGATTTVAVAGGIFNTTPAPDLIVSTSMRGGGVGSEHRYSWVTNAQVLNLAPSDNLQYLLEYVNNSGGVGSFVAYIPVPNAGGVAANLANPEMADVQREAFGFTLNLLSHPASLPAGFVVTYSLQPLSAAIDGTATFQPWASVEGNRQQIRTIRVESSLMPDGAQGYIAFDMEVPTDVEGAINAAYLGQVNRYGARTWRSAAGTSVFGASSSATAVRMWERVNFQYNYTGSDGLYDIFDVAHGGLVTLPTPPSRENHSFLGWSTTPSDVDLDYEFDFDLPIDRTLMTAGSGILNLYAQWRLNTYNVTHGVATVGTFPTPQEGLPTPAAVAHGVGATVYAAPALTTTSGTNGGVAGSWIFEHWAVAGVTGTTTLNAGAPFTMPANGVTLTAVWRFEAGTYSVTHQVATAGDFPTLQNNMPTPASASYIAGATVYAAPALTTTSAARGTTPGVWTFEHWAVEGVVGVTTLNAGEPFAMPANGVTLTAVWSFEVATYSVAFDVNGGGGAAPASQTITHGEFATNPNQGAMTPPAHHSFVGWFAHPTTGTTPFDFATAITSNTTLYARWSLDVFVVTFAAGVNGAIYTPDAGMTLVNVDAGTLVTSARIPSLVADAGYGFSHWISSNDPSVNLTAAQVAAYVIEEATTFTAIFTAIPPHQVSFSLHGGAGSFPNQTINHGDLATEPTSQPTRSGYIFAGWDFDFTTPITSDIVINASWTVDGGGEPDPTPNLNFNKSANPAHGSYVVAGQVVTYTIRVSNIGDANAYGVVMRDDIPTGMTFVVGSANITPAVSNNALTWNIPTIAPGQTVEVYFQVTVDPLPENVFTKTFRNRARVDGSYTNAVDLFIQGLLKTPDRTTVSPGQTINWTLQGFHNPTGYPVANFAIIDTPGVGLNFQSGSLPAFTNGTGITYDIRYRIAGDNTWHTHIAGVDAAAPFSFSLPQTGSLHYTYIGLFFGDVPAGFGASNEIVLTFIVGSYAPNNLLINNFAIMFNNITIPGETPDNPPTLLRPGGEGGGPATTPTSTIPFNPIHLSYLIGDVYGNVRPNASI
ncbi:MAG: InlB B-repeat-containing protein, partial [Defluviitaleaceae bacterium]|nr:InlB B-repeat-containing protein [Defluviitaleaceae bacterium]